MALISGVYRAVCLEVTNDRIRCQVPQLFADETVTCFDTAGPVPAAGDEGFVSFESGQANKPVWMGSEWEAAVVVDGGPGSSGTVSYVYNQGTAAAVWTITHNLGFYPNVTVIDSSGAVVEGDTTFLGTNQLRINFSGAFSGTAYLS